MIRTAKDVVIRQWKTIYDTLLQGILSHYRHQNIYTTTYHPQCNGKVERFNRTILSALRDYLGDLPRDWDLLTNESTYEYNTQIYRTMNIEPFELVLSRPQPHLALEEKPLLEVRISTRDSYMAWLRKFRILMATAKKHMIKAQELYKSDFDHRDRLPRQRVRICSHAYMRKDYSSTEETNHKLAQLATGPHLVTDVDEKSVSSSGKRISRKGSR